MANDATKTLDEKVLHRLAHEVEMADADARACLQSTGILEVLCDATLNGSPECSKRAEEALTHLARQRDVTEALIDAGAGETSLLSVRLAPDEDDGSLVGLETLQLLSERNGLERMFRRAQFVASCLPPDGQEGRDGIRLIHVLCLQQVTVHLRWNNDFYSLPNALASRPQFIQSLGVSIQDWVTRVKRNTANHDSVMTYVGMTQRLLNIVRSALGDWAPTEVKEKLYTTGSYPPGRRLIGAVATAGSFVRELVANACNYSVPPQLCTHFMDCVEALNESLRFVPASERLKVCECIRNDPAVEESLLHMMEKASDPEWRSECQHHWESVGVSPSSMLRWLTAGMICAETIFSTELRYADEPDAQCYRFAYSMAKLLKSTDSFGSIRKHDPSCSDDSGACSSEIAHAETSNQKENVKSEKSNEAATPGVSSANDGTVLLCNALCSLQNVVGCDRSAKVVKAYKPYRSLLRIADAPELEGVLPDREFRQKSVLRLLMLCSDDLPLANDDDSGFTEELARILNDDCRDRTLSEMLTGLLTVRLRDAQAVPSLKQGMDKSLGSMPYEDVEELRAAEQWFKHEIPALSPATASALLE